MLSSFIFFVHASKTTYANNSTVNPNTKLVVVTGTIN